MTDALRADSASIPDDIIFDELGLSDSLALDDDSFAALERDEADRGELTEWADDLDYEPDYAPAPEPPEDRVELAQALAKRLGRIVPDDILASPRMIETYIVAAQEEVDMYARPLQVVGGTAVATPAKTGTVIPMPAPAQPAGGDWTAMLEGKIDKKGNLISADGSEHNVRTVLLHDPRTKGKLGYNEWRMSIDIMSDIAFGVGGLRDITGVPRGGRPISDLDYASITGWLGTPDHLGGYGLRARKEIIDLGVLNTAQTISFNPLHQMIERVEWDGVPRLDTVWIDYLGAEDNIYVREAARLSFTAAVARAYVPGVDAQNMIVLQGGQGSLKSLLLRATAGQFWGELGSGQIRTPKELIEAMRGVWICEMPEMEAWIETRTDAKRKMFLSSSKEIARMAYGRESGEYHRRFAFFGTLNPDKFLTDDSGNRRPWIINVSEKYNEFNPIDIKKFRRNRDQILAEALVVFRKMQAAVGEHEELYFSLSDAAKKIQAQVALDAMEEDPADELVGIIERVISIPLDRHMSEVIGPKGVIEIDGQCYRRVWCRMGLKDAIRAEFGETAKTFGIDDMIAAKGRGSLIAKSLKRLEKTRLMKEGSTYEIRGFEKYGRQKSLVIDADALTALIRP